MYNVQGILRWVNSFQRCFHFFSSSTKSLQERSISLLVLYVPWPLDKQSCLSSMRRSSDFLGKHRLLFGWVLETKGFLQKLSWCKMNSHCDVIFRCARDIPLFGGAEFASMGQQRGRVWLADELLKLWNFAGLNVGCCSHAWSVHSCSAKLDNASSLKFHNNLSCYGSGQRPGESSLFNGGPGAIQLLSPRLMFVLVVAQLIKVVVRLICCE